MNKRAFLYILLVFSVLSGGQIKKSEANLPKYLDEVKESHSGFRGYLETMKSLEKKKEKASLPFVTELFGTAEWLEDKGPRLNPTFQGDSREQTTMKLGVRKQSRYGLNLELAYESIHEIYRGRPASFFALNDYYTNQLTLRLEQSLLQNAFGRKARSDERAEVLQYESEHLNAEREAVSILVEAEKIYWELAFNERIVETLEESVKRTQDILNYNKRRFDRRVIENGEVLQAKADLLSRKLQYEEAQDTYDQVLEDFRSFLETSKVVTPPLETPTYQEALNLQQPKLSEKTANYLSKQREVRAQKEKIKSLKESSKPDLKLYGSLASSDIQANYSRTNESTFQVDNPITTFGVEFSTPLAYTKIDTLFEAYTQEAEAAQMTLERLSFDEQIQKEKLIKRFNDLKGRLDLAKNLEAAQKEKLELEKRYQRNGRSTTYDVLLFERDYLDAQVQGLRLRLSIMNVFADFKNYQRLKL